MIRRITLGFLAVIVVGCAKEPMADNTTIPDAYPGLKGEARVEAIRKDPTILTAEKAAKISEAQKEAGLPVTGQ